MIQSFNSIVVSDRLLKAQLPLKIKGTFERATENFTSYIARAALRVTERERSLLSLLSPYDLIHPLRLLAICKDGGGTRDRVESG